MGAETTRTTPQLERALKLRDLVLFNLVAVLGLRHLATSAEFGPSSLIIWIIAAFFFFVPQGLAVIELSSRFPKEGGIYAWTKSALGEGHGFLCGWCYWINNVLYYPNLLMSTAVIALYVAGKGGSALEEDWHYVLPTTLIALWAAVAVNIIGVGKGKWLQNAGGIGTYIPGIIIILLGIYGMMTQAGAHAINAQTIKPDFTDFPSLNLLATIAFAFAGLELASTMGDEVENPRRNLPRSVFVSAPLIAFAYILGTASVLWLVSDAEINRVSGFLQAIENGARNLSPAFWWLGPLCAALYTIGTVGGVGAWLIGPARVAFVIGLDRYFPPSFGRVHPRWHTPYIVILVQASLATIFLFLSVLGSGAEIGGVTVKEVYLILLDTQVLIYFIPYVYLFIVFLMHRQRGEVSSEVTQVPGGPVGAWLTGLSGLAITIFAMVVATIPPPGSKEPWLFSIKVLGGAVGFVLLGGLIYWRAKWRAMMIALLFIAGLAGCSAQQADQPSSAAIPGTNDKLQGSNRFERQGWVYVHLEGTPEKIGYQHGNLLAKEIEDLLRVMKPFLQHQSKRDWNFYRESAEKMLWPKMEREYQDEIDGIVAGATAIGVKLDRYDVVAMNAFIELAQYYVPWLEKKQGLQASTKAPGNCSAFIATGSWTKDGRIVIGHNTWTEYVVGSRWNIIFDIKPEKGHRILMDGLPGVIASMDDFGVNSSGIMITETTITGFSGFDPNGTPEFMRARKAMQYSNSIDDYVRIMLDGNNGGYANDWLVGDNKTGEIALFELGLREHSVRRTRDGYFVGSNFPVDEKLLKAETNFDPKNKANSPNARRTRWEQLMAEYKGRIDIEAAKKFETDGFDAFAKKQGANDRTLCGAVEMSPRGVPEWDWPAYFPGGTVQAKVMDAQMAGKMQLWAAYGHPCAPDFIADDFLKQRKEYEWMRGLLRDMRNGDWALFETTR